MRSKIVVGLAGVALLALAFVLIDNNTGWFSKPGDFEQSASVQPPVVMNAPTLAYGMVVTGLQRTEAEVRRNQTFTDLLKGYRVPASAYQQLARIPKNQFDFRKIVARKKYTLFSETDSLHTLRALVYESSPVDYTIFHFTPDSLWIEPCQRPITVVEKGIAGVIETNLSETVENLGISHELTNKFVDIFAWVVDFQRLQKGDRFRILYDEQQVEGKPYAVGRIHGILFEHARQPLYAFPMDQGEGLDYFDERGHSLRKALLKYPIEFTRISSRYNLSRFHPVAKVFRAHLGTDFAAPTGTPIRSVGDGLVEEAQYKANNGNYVKIRHNSTYTTGYLHMSKIAADVRAGTRVRQGQVIGYVGSTGLANGPHLCYRFWRNGVQEDALKVELPPSQPIQPAFWGTFNLLKETLRQQLQTIADPPRSPEVIVATTLF